LVCGGCGRRGWLAGRLGDLFHEFLVVHAICVPLGNGGVAFFVLVLEVFVGVGEGAGAEEGEEED